MSRPGITLENSLLAERAKRDPEVVVGTRKQRWTTTMLGCVLLAEGLGKALAPGGYFAALAQFRFWPDGAVSTLGAAWMALELACGLGLLAAGLARNPPRVPALLAAVGAVVLQLAYATMSTQAYVRGLHIANCTCFGVHLAQHLSWFVLVQDAYMIFFSSWQLKKLAGWRPR